VTTGRREWEDPITDRDWGILETSQGREEKQNSTDWYTWSAVSQTVTFLKKIVMSAGAWFQNIIIGSGSAQGSLNGVAKTGVTTSYNGWNSHIVTPSYLDEFGNTRYLRKDVADTAAEKIGFVKGLWVKAINAFGISADGDATLRDATLRDATMQDATMRDVTARKATMSAQATTPDVRSTATPNDATIGGSGFHAYVDGSGNGHVLTDFMEVRKKATFAEVEVREVTFTSGELVTSNASGKVLAVLAIGYSGEVLGPAEDFVADRDPVYAWRVLLRADDGTTETQNTWHVGDQARCQTFNLTREAELDGTTVHIPNNRYYWRLVLKVGMTEYAPSANEEPQQMHFVDLGEENEPVNAAGIAQDCLAYADIKTAAVNAGVTNILCADSKAANDVPQAGDKIAQMGSQTDSDRMGFTVSKAEGTDTGYYVYAGVNTYSTTGKLVSKLTPAEVLLTAKKLTIQSDPTAGDAHPLTNFRGEWLAGHNLVSSYYDEWTYQGERWLYVNANTTSTEAPGTTPANWLKTVAKGSGVPEYKEQEYAKSSLVSGMDDTAAAGLSWGSTIPSTDPNNPYIWMRSRVRTLQADGSYSQGSWSYVRLSGESATATQIKGTVNYVANSAASLPTTSDVPDKATAIVLNENPLYIYDAGGEEWEQMAGTVPVAGDAYINDQNGHLIVNVNGASWKDCGPFRGEDGTAGEDAVNVWLATNADFITLNKQSGQYEPSYIQCRVYHQVGSEAPTDITSAVYSRLFLSIDNGRPFLYDGSQLDIVMEGMRRRADFYLMSGITEVYSASIAMVNDGEDGDDAFGIDLTPGTVVIEQATELVNNEYPLTYPKAIVNVTEGESPVAATVTATFDTSGIGGCDCSIRTVSTGKYELTLSNLTPGYVTVNGQQKLVLPDTGRFIIQVTPTGSTSAHTLYLNFLVNKMGEITTTIKGDVETTVASKITHAVDPSGQHVGTLEQLGTYIRSASENTATISEKMKPMNYIEEGAWECYEDTTDDGTEKDVNGEWHITTDEAWDATDKYIDIVSPAVLLPAGTWVFSAFIDSGVMPYLCTDSSETDPIDMVDTEMSWTLYDQTYHGTGRRYFVFELTEAKYVRIELYKSFSSDYSGIGNFSFYWPILEAGDKPLTIDTATGFVAISSQFHQTSRQITLEVNDTKDGLRRTGIDITAGKVVIQGNKFEIWNNDKTIQTLEVDQDGNMTAAGGAYFGGKIQANQIYYAQQLLYDSAPNVNVGTSVVCVMNDSNWGSNADYSSSNHNGILLPHPSEVPGMMVYVLNQRPGNQLHIVSRAPSGSAGTVGNIFWDVVNGSVADKVPIHGLNFIQLYASSGFRTGSDNDHEWVLIRKD